MYIEEDPSLRRKIIEKTHNRVRFRLKLTTDLIFLIGQTIGCAAFMYIAFESRVKCQRIDSDISCDWHTSYHAIGTKQVTNIMGLRTEPSFLEEGPNTLIFLITEAGEVEVHGNNRSVEVVNNFIQDGSRENLFFLSNRVSLITALIFGGASFLTLKCGETMRMLTFDKRMNRLELESRGFLTKQERVISLDEIIDIKLIERKSPIKKESFFVVGAILQDSQVVFLVPETPNIQEQEALCKYINLFLADS